MVNLALVAALDKTGADDVFGLRLYSRGTTRYVDGLHKLMKATKEGPLHPNNPL